MADRMEAQAWTGRGRRPKAGTLTLQQGRLRFELHEDGRVAFDEPVGGLSLSWPWYGFGCQFWAHSAGENYFVSFVHTNNTLYSWWEGVTTGRCWNRAIRAALVNAPA